MFISYNHHPVWICLERMGNRQVCVRFCKLCSKHPAKWNISVVRGLNWCISLYLCRKEPSARRQRPCQVRRAFLSEWDAGAQVGWGQQAGEAQQIEKGTHTGQGMPVMGYRKLDCGKEGSDMGRRSDTGSDPSRVRRTFTKEQRWPLPWTTGYLQGSNM